MQASSEEPAYPPVPTPAQYPNSAVDDHLIDGRLNYSLPRTITDSLYAAEHHHPFAILTYATC